MASRDAEKMSSGTCITAMSSEGATTHIDDLFMRLRGAVNRVCPSSMHYLREDILQAAMLRLIELLKRDGDDRQFTDTYLRKVAYTVLVDELRRSKRRPEFSQNAPSSPDDASALDPASQRPNPEQATLGRELGAAIAACLTKIRMERRQAVLLYLAGYTLLESAQILGWPKKRTENSTYRGMADLRSCLEQKGINP